MNTSDDGWDAGTNEDESILDTLYGGVFPVTNTDESASAATSDGDHDTVESLIFTVTNPLGTVSVATLSNGAPYRVELAPEVARMTEHELIEEISLIARLARQNALAGQHLIISGMLSNSGLDRAFVRSYLERDLGLPSMEAALADKARIFATRYEREED
ncbi:hypothetical protein [Mycolicibacterium mucogenicum]|uniref:Secretion protein EspD n=1 Tax=Mycolicibacterium mucogenicum DSM 44124 TaxID=1226753 RepID=A0A8H2JGS7_MYCMU|nr:hypothetical protein [Mycolicibacterium mucogenicum]KAB7760974.1 secretion protein EspD [Mycolicibacterium mucogenicum DSM 44124]QPG69240.1 YbaB/EbfC family DNA-binding protein [Mycolicibacterium mucogenicum DSM 44124]